MTPRAGNQSCRNAATYTRDNTHTHTEETRTSVSRVGFEPRPRGHRDRFKKILRDMKTVVDCVMVKFTIYNTGTFGWRNK
jgi:hypothetical protein